MGRTKRHIPLAVCIGIVAALTACGGSTTIRYGEGSAQPAMKKQGPPPHAPAHGYRHKHGDVNLVYKSDIGVYIVEGHTGIYFYHESYYRWHDDAWQISAQVNGPWKGTSESKVPKGLQKQHKKAGKPQKKK